MPSMTTETQRFRDLRVRLPLPILQLLQREARKEHRPVSSQLVVILEERYGGKDA